MPGYKSILCFYTIKKFSTIQLPTFFRSDYNWPGILSWPEKSLLTPKPGCPLLRIFGRLGLSGLFAYREKEAEVSFPRPSCSWL